MNPKNIPYIPEFFVGDKLWKMNNNLPVEFEVVETVITYWPNVKNGKMKVSVKHTLTGGHTFNECTPDMPGDCVHRTKKELLNSL